MKKRKKRAKKSDAGARASKVRKTPAPSSPTTPPQEVDEEKLAEVMALAKKQADGFLRDEYRERLRLCLFVGAGLFVASVFALVVLVPAFDLEGEAAYGVVLAPIGALLALWFFKFRCTRCNQIPIHPSIMMSFRTLDIPGCPHCGLNFQHDDEDEEERAPLDEVGA